VLSALLHEFSAVFKALVGQASETVSKLVTARESCYGRWGYTRVARTLYVRVAKRQEARISCKQRSLRQRDITSCAPAYAGAPGGSSLRATQCSTISTTSGILRQFRLACPWGTGKMPVATKIPSISDITLGSSHDSRHSPKILITCLPACFWITRSRLSLRTPRANVPSPDGPSIPVISRNISRPLAM